MDEDNEVYIAPEEQDPERLERILRHSSRRQDAPMVLVQLPDSNPQPELPFQQRVTLVNMAGTSPVVLQDEMDPFEWHFRRNTPDLRTTLVREGSVDELTTRRKSRIGGNPMEQLDFIVNTQTFNNQSPYYDEPETGDNGGDISKTTEPRCQYEMEEDPEALKQYGAETLQNNDIQNLLRDDVSVNVTEEDGDKQLYELERNSDEQLPIIDTIMKSLVNYNKEIRVMPAEFSNKDQKSPFQKERDERSRRPSSRVRVFIMVDELDEDDSLEDERRRKRKAKGDGRRGRSKYRQGERGSLDSLDSTDETRKEYISDKPPLSDQRKDKSGRGRSDDEDDFGRYKGGEGTKRGRKPGYGDEEGDGRGKDKRGRRPGDRDYDERKPGFGNDERGKRGKDIRGRRPGDRDYDERKYGDGTRTVDRPDEGYDGDKKGRRDKDKRGKGKPGGDNDSTKYRLVSMPKSATTLTTRRRYHVQITDHKIKEPWFNSCFNIGKDNNVDLNYEGPVKITPYYVGDKFS